MELRVGRITLRHKDGRALHVYGDHGPVTPFDDGPANPESTGLHLRHDVLTDAWIGVSPRRNTRPHTEGAASADATCPLCPGGPEVPFDYTAAVFDNRFPSLVSDPPTAPVMGQATAPSCGRSEVVLYTSAHEGSLGDLPPERLAGVVAMWADRSSALWAQPGVAHVMAFENRGEAVGATLSHPHGQIYAFDRLPPVVRERAVVLERHRDAMAECLSCRLVVDDTHAADRHLLDGDHFTVTVPFAARWPHEVHIRARRHGLRRLHDLTAEERREFAHALRTVVTAYDAIYDRPLPYMMTIMEAPRTGQGPAEDWHLSVEFLPPNRSADRLKLRASVETATGFFINDTVPEAMATQLVQALARAGGVPTTPIPDVVIAPKPLPVVGARGAAVSSQASTVDPSATASPTVG